MNIVHQRDEFFACSFAVIFQRPAEHEARYGLGNLSGRRPHSNFRHAALNVPAATPAVVTAAAAAYNEGRGLQPAPPARPLADTLASAFLYFDVSFMVWTMLGALGAP